MKSLQPNQRNIHIHVSASIIVFIFILTQFRPTEEYKFRQSLTAINSRQIFVWILSQATNRRKIKANKGGKCGQKHK